MATIVSTVGTTRGTMQESCLPEIRSSSTRLENLKHPTMSAIKCYLPSPLFLSLLFGLN
ncbi:MAG: hypothetical protein ACTSRK_11430 [Promethearchaeota archaeon]